jgi:[glutamine synthetase] adenylyltransferase / [glutamine synthetase]-adenylyl-L-tyrosine phosphorylase
MHFKLGPGGLSDVEFAIQTVQLTNAGRHEELRVSSTYDALEAARRCGVVGDTEAEMLEEAYRFLMRLRNHAFLATGRPVDSLPDKPEDLEALGIALGFSEQPRQELEDAYLRITRRARKVAEPLIYGRSSG